MAKLPIFRAIFGALFLLLGAGAVHAHPHVWIVAKAELVFAPDGSVIAIKHAWTFDEMYSAFATQGLDKNNDGKLAREELAELAEVNVTTLKEFDYFSAGRAGGTDMKFGDPTDYYLSADKDKILTLHFTLPLKVKAPKGSFSLEMFDPTFFIDIGFADDKAVSLLNPPPGCVADVQVPNQGQQKTLSESMANSPGAAAFASQFASRVTIKCK
jgi:ABC-type uncharacterized transport system substrate-binding protein